VTAGEHTDSMLKDNPAFRIPVTPTQAFFLPKVLFGTRRKIVVFNHAVADTAPYKWGGCWNLKRFLLLFRVNAASKTDTAYEQKFNGQPFFVTPQLGGFFETHTAGIRVRSLGRPEPTGRNVLPNGRVIQERKTICRRPSVRTTAVP